MFPIPAALGGFPGGNLCSAQGLLVSCPAFQSVGERLYFTGLIDYRLLAEIQRQRPLTDRVRKSDSETGLDVGKSFVRQSNRIVKTKPRLNSQPDIIFTTEIYHRVRRSRVMVNNLQ